MRDPLYCLHGIIVYMIKMIFLYQVSLMILL